MTQLIGLTVMLAAFWLLLSGHYVPMFFGFGAFSVLLVAWLAKRMDIVDDEAKPLHWLLRVPRYWLWLGGQILLSALAVSRLIWQPRAPITPGLGRANVEGLSDVERATYANSITLTPGTLSMTVDERHIEVHALDVRALANIEAGEMIRRLRRAGLR
ncbi:Na+/H+ antiporter subunit E [Sinimarinibacterium thermocellulolyticum]|uniref:Na+/H+ antiporter subunit E n=1 Tax=Sinimarinibacterium thermocellulolyticum TaxID=3170016 RepID=A0ABV2A7E6_9GAMM